MQLPGGLSNFTRQPQQQQLSIKGGSIHRPSSATLKRKDGQAQQQERQEELRNYLQQ